MIVTNVSVTLMFEECQQLFLSLLV